MDKTEQNILKEIQESTIRYKNCSKCHYNQEEEVAKAKLQGYQLAQKETAEKVEKLKDNLPKYYTRKELLELIDKIFNEDKIDNSPNKSEATEMHLPLIKEQLINKQVQTGLDTSSEDNECDCQMFIGGSGKLCPECRKEKI